MSFLKRFLVVFFTSVVIAFAAGNIVKFMQSGGQYRPTIQDFVGAGLEALIYVATVVVPKLLQAVQLIISTIWTALLSVTLAELVVTVIISLWIGFLIFIAYLVVESGSNFSEFWGGEDDDIGGPY